MSKPTPFLWFNDDAEEAVNLYVSIFPNSKILSLTRYGAGGPGPAGAVMTAAFQLDGQDFVALNGGPLNKFNEAVSFVINCETQAEVDRFWDQLTSGGGQPGPCGWLKDKYGLSWQVVPTILPQLLSGKDPAKSARAMAAMMKMGKLDGAALERAYDGN
ncbi:MAG TPA: VOC family protein [Polyangia bacterium]|jgi:predicted 3-demethylubiquinone-9 3-methyltransferase (glyoxalase superfamily)|nr:VOC family protein [Polyangia bacterium]